TRVICEFVYSDRNKMQVIPREQLKANSEYWLVIHPGIKDVAGLDFGGGIAVARTTAE
ncbi:MAG: Ig-like domain-containing protein, partial [Peptococcaceae bacterium]|nr:Ig-like domain-containing protein [Peptococcaceae bacterium]